jgi:hypothetical protein
MNGADNNDGFLEQNILAKLALAAQSDNKDEVARLTEDALAIIRSNPHTVALLTAKLRSAATAPTTANGREDADVSSNNVTKSTNQAEHSKQDIVRDLRWPKAAITTCGGTHVIPIISLAACASLSRLKPATEQVWIGSKFSGIIKPRYNGRSEPQQRLPGECHGCRSCSHHVCRRCCIPVRATSYHQYKFQRYMTVISEAVPDSSLCEIVKLI